MLCCMAALAISLCSACREDSPTPAPEPDRPTVDSPDTGEVEFTVDLPEGIGSGTASSPVAVPAGEALSLEIAQTSSYTDPDGRVITRTPRATIALEVRQDTVVAKDLASLTRLPEQARVNTTISGESPARYSTEQKLLVGTQEIALDLAYEVYTLTNSAGRQIEMPYVRLDPAEFGGAGTTEETPRGRAAIAVSAVTVRPLPVSRAHTVTDSTIYEVEVRFNIGMQSMNTAGSDAQALEFSATYIGVVETKTTLEDPTVDLTYAWEPKSGFSTTASPFVQTRGQDMELWLTQTSVYTDEYLNRYTATPKAQIKVSAVRDTVWADSADALTAIVETSGDASGLTSATQTFVVGGRTIGIDWNYEAAAAPDGIDVEMPYYRLSPVKLKDVTRRKLRDNNTETSGKNVDAYLITATFSQTATAQSPVGDFAHSFEVEYVVTYTGAVEVKLVDVKYNRRYEWYEAHDNLPLRNCYIVERTFVYSNGETKTEEYRSSNYMVDINCATDDIYGMDKYYNYPLDNGEYINFSPNKLILSDDYHTIFGMKTGVPDLNKLSHRISEDDYNIPNGPEHYSLYWIFGTDISFGSENRRQGWYIRWCVHNRVLSIMYEDYTEMDYGILRMRLNPGFIDRFFYFADTDTIIDFNDMRLEREYNVTVEDTHIPEGPARIYKHECNATYLGRNFYIATIDTVYQNR